MYVDKPHTVEAGVVDQTSSEIMTIARVPERQGVGLAEATATFTELGDAQLKRAAGETGDTIDPSMRLG